MELDDDFKEMCDFVESYTGVMIGKYFDSLASDDNIRINIRPKDTPNPELKEMRRKLIIAHEVGEMAYVRAHQDQSGWSLYCGLKRLYGECVGDYFSHLYFEKEIKNRNTEKKRYVLKGQLTLTNARYYLAKHFVDKLMEKPESEQLIEIQQLIFREFPETITFKLTNKVLCLLEKLGIF